MRTLLLTISLLICNLVLYSQEVINTTFVVNAVSDSSRNLTIEPADPVISSLSGKESVDKFATMAPGLLVAPIQAAENLLYVIDAYAMPSSYMLYIQAEGKEASEFRFALFDNSGKLIKQQKLGGINTELSLEDYPAGKYIVKIVQTGKDLKAFEVFKK